MALMRIETAVVKNSEWRIFKTLNLDSIRIQLDNNTLEYFRIKNIIKKYSDTRRELLGLEAQVETFLELSTDRLHQILPSSVRVKRGLLNPLGSLVKVITGNLDNENALSYEKQISSLKNKEHSVELKLLLMQKAFDKLVNISEDMDFNVQHIRYKTLQIDTLLNEDAKLNKIISLMDSLNQILNNILIIYTIIQEVETAIAFCKIRILHQSIINSTELFNILKIEENHNQLIYPVTMHKLIKLERNIVLK